MAQITVTPKSGNHYLVTVSQGGSSTTHQVTVTPDHLARYGDAGTSPEKLLHASFGFLLEHEPKESILSKFDLSVIERYFPEFPRQIRKRL